MKFKISTWPKNSRAECIEAFAEKVVELTNKYSIDSYRHRTLSTTDKAFELSDWVGKVKNKLVPKPTLNVMIDEYDSSLTSDPVVEEICEKNRIPIDALKIKMTFSLERMDAALSLFKDLVVPNYEKVSIRLISNSADMGEKGKYKITRLAEFLIPHIISTGKSRDFLHIIAKRHFFRCPNETSEDERLRNFINAATKEKKEYEILIRCGRDFAENFCSFTRTEILSWSDLPAHFKYSVSESTGKYVKITYKGNDPLSVASGVKFLTELLKSFTFIFPTKSRSSEVFMIFTYDFETGEVYRVSPNEFLNMGPIVRDKDKRDQSMKGLAKFVLGRRSRGISDSTTQIIPALLTASSASKISDQNACLASIWSAFEALLPAPMKDGERSTRITYFADIITPLATVSYPRELYHGFYSDLARNHTSDFHSFIDSRGDGKDRFEKFLSIFYLSNNIQNEFTRIFSEHHIFRMRAMTLFKLANNPKELHKALRDHDRRVHWQVHRIYRERNDIMHSAISSKYARSLIENSFSYFKSMVLTLLRASDSYDVKNVDSLIELCLALHKNHGETLAGYQDSQGKEALFHAIKGAVP